MGGLVPGGHIVKARTYRGLQLCVPWLECVDDSRVPVSVPGCGEGLYILTALPPLPPPTHPCVACLSPSLSLLSFALRLLYYMCEAFHHQGWPGLTDGVQLLLLHVGTVHTHTHTHTHAHTHILLHTHTRAHYYIHTHTHSPIYTHALSHKHTHAHILSLSHTHTHTLSHIKTICIHTHTCTHTLSHTHTHSLTHVHAHTYMQTQNTRMHACTHAHSHTHKDWSEHTCTHTSKHTHTNEDKVQIHTDAIFRIPIKCNCCVIIRTVTAYSIIQTMDVFYIFYTIITVNIACVYVLNWNIHLTEMNTAERHTHTHTHTLCTLWEAFKGKSASVPTLQVIIHCLVSGCQLRGAQSACHSSLSLSLSLSLSRSLSPQRRMPARPAGTPPRNTLTNDRRCLKHAQI